MAEKERISERISLKALAVFGSCKIKTICTVRGEILLLYTTRESKLSPSTAQLCHDLSLWAWQHLVGLTMQGNLQNHPGTNESLLLTGFGQQAARKVSEHWQMLRGRKTLSLSPTVFPVPAVAEFNSAAGCVDAHALSWVWLKQCDENRQGELGSFRADSPRGSWQDGRNAPALWTYFQ